MEIMGAAFAAAIIVGFLERRDRRHAFPPGPCRYCAQSIHFDGRQWVHDDGFVYAQWPNLDYDIPGHPAPLHPAVPQHSSTIDA